jgi:hypothetical protein
MITRLIAYIWNKCPLNDAWETITPRRLDTEIKVVI